MAHKDKYTFNIQLETQDLWKFSLYHSYKGLRGIFNLLFTIAGLYVLITTWNEMSTSYRVLMICCVLMFTVIQPAMLYMKSAKQAKSPAVKELIKLEFDDTGLTVHQLGQTAGAEWDNIYRVVYAMKMLIIYTDGLHAYLIKDTDMGESKEGFFELIQEKMPKQRRRGI